jgi:hypothetical protein
MLEGAFYLGRDKSREKKEEGDDVLLGSAVSVFDTQTRQHGSRVVLACSLPPLRGGLLWVTRRLRAGMGDPSGYRPKSVWSTTSGVRL